MGYILPIQHLTYTQYQQRIKPSKINHYNISRPYPVEMNNESQSHLFHFRSEQQNMGVTVEFSSASIEGKGEYINTYV